MACPLHAFRPDLWHGEIGIPSTFNHSKIVAGDGLYALAGGHNIAESLSSHTAPVIHDMTCEITGPGARSANTFAGSLWIKAAESGKLDILSFSWDKQAFKDVTAAMQTLWAPAGWLSKRLGKQLASKHLGKQDLVAAHIKNNLYYYDMATLPTEVIQ